MKDHSLIFDLREEESTAIIMPSWSFLFFEKIGGIVVEKEYRANEVFIQNAVVLAVG